VNLLSPERRFLQNKTSHKLRVTVGCNSASESESMICRAAHPQAVEKLADRGKKLGNLIARHHKSAVGCQMTPIVFERLSRHHVAFAKAECTRREGGVAHRVNGNDAVVLFFRPADKAAAVFRYQPDLGLVEKSTPILAHP